MRKIYTITILTILLSAMQVQAQEVRHYWLNNQSLYNPGMTGANEDVVGSVIANQEQVLNFPGAPRTGLVQFNGRLGYSNSSLGGGISFEEYGVLKDYTGFMSYSYAVTLKKERRLIFGVGGAFSLIQENGSSLTTTFAGDDIYKLNTTGLCH
jgi:type IX secretion system PorP/SprF family membrane protein